MILLGDSIPSCHEAALREASVRALREWLADHSIVLRDGRRVVTDALGLAIVRALGVIDEPLDERPDPWRAAPTSAPTSTERS